jgi:TRAP-type mannitol/chloroaromatic compound transport system permease small subunit
VSVSRVESVVAVWTRRLLLLGGWLLLAVALVTVADALLRSVAGRPIQGTFEGSELVLAAIIFFGLPYTSLTDGHVSVDFLTSRLGIRTQHAINAGNAVICAMLLGLISVQMGFLAGEYLAIGRTTITMRIPVFPCLALVTAAAGLAALGCVMQAVGAGRHALRAQMPPSRSSPA